jgi:anthranilate synthase component 1
LCTLAKQGNLVPVYETFTADLLTPVGAYLRLAKHSRYACLLESVEGGEKIARYTFVGANPVEVFRYVNGACVLEGESRVSWVQENPLDFLRNRLERYKPVRVPDLPPLTAGAIGYFAYDMVRLFERLPDETRNDLKMDDAVMMFYLGSGRVRPRPPQRDHRAQRFHRRRGQSAHEISRRDSADPRDAQATGRAAGRNPRQEDG